MTFLHAALLGALQGLCEFLPISSSGHLKLAQFFLGLDSSSLMHFDLICHFGTFFASILVFRKEIVNLFTKDQRSIPLFALALLPLVPMYILFKKVFSFSSLHFLGPFFILTGILLYLTTRKKPNFGTSWPHKHNLKHSLLIGIAQSFALFPGLSRSGASISMAKMLGWNIRNAVVFSYLLSMPAILGGMILELPHMNEVLSWEIVIGFCVSFVVGFATIKGFLYFIEKYSLKPFAYYCIGLGIVTLLYFW